MNVHHPRYPIALFAASLFFLMSPTVWAETAEKTNPPKIKAPATTKRLVKPAAPTWKKVSPPKNRRSVPPPAMPRNALAPEDARFLAARDAFRKGDTANFKRLSAELSNHDLAIYLDYWPLTVGLNDPGEAPAKLPAVHSFLSAHDGDLLAERLRQSLIREWARRGQWESVSQETSKLINPELEMRCLSLRARLARQDTTAWPLAHALWLTTPELPDACDALEKDLLDSQKLAPEALWTRIRFLFELNRLPQTRALFKALPEAQRPDARSLDLLMDRIPLWMAQQTVDRLKTPTARQMLILGLQRLARTDPEHAASHLKTLEEALLPDERALAWAQIALQGARRLLPEAHAWYTLTTPTSLSDENMQWKVRTALRLQDWGRVRETIEGMPPELASRPEWIYWLGRAYHASGRSRDAETQFRRIAGQAHFYGNLADEALGIPIALPPHARPASKEEIAQISKRPGLQRALAWFRMGERVEGVREWTWALRHLNDRELLAAAALAERNALFDRAISAANNTRQEHDFSLRYLAPFSAEVRAASQKQGIDDAWVYGLMRQESRFVTSARSTVGASGLMQLMPTTARWVARKIGLKDYTAKQVNNTETNLLLGTTYMKLVLENLSNHPVLASAAYNAGPGRARKWCGDIPLEGAVYAESIPFPETRDYVKKVMSNAVYYAMLFTGKPDSLRRRLGVIPSRSGVETPIDPDLP